MLGRDLEIHKEAVTTTRHAKELTGGEYRSKMVEDAIPETVLDAAARCASSGAKLAC